MRCKVQIGNVVNDIVISMCGTKCVLEIPRVTLCKVSIYLTTMLKPMQSNIENKLYSNKTYIK